MDDALSWVGIAVFLMASAALFWWSVRGQTATMRIPDGATAGLAALPPSQYIEGTIINSDGTELRRIVVLVERDGVIVTVESADPDGWILLGTDETLVVPLTEGIVFTMSCQ